MADRVHEEDLLQSIEEVEVKIQNFCKKVRAVLADLQDDEAKSPPGNQVRAKT